MVDLPPEEPLSLPLFTVVVVVVLLLPLLPLLPPVEVVELEVVVVVTKGLVLEPPTADAKDHVKEPSDECSESDL